MIDKAIEDHKQLNEGLIEINKFVMLTDMSGGQQQKPEPQNVNRSETTRDILYSGNIIKVDRATSIGKHEPGKCSKCSEW